MKVAVHPNSPERRDRRAAAKIAACLLLVLGFMLIASATFSPLLATSPGSPLAQASNPTRSKTPSLSSTPASRLSGPRLVPGQPAADANTVALYHFDAPSGSSAIDATGQYPGSLIGNANITTSGLYGGVLQLDGRDGPGSYVNTGYMGSLNSGTIEAFVDLSTACQGAVDYFPIINAVNETTGQSVAELGVRGAITFGILSNDQWIWVDSGVNACRYLTGSDQAENFGIWGLPVLWPYETWRFHHVAGTWGPRGMEIWIDGVLHGVGNDDPNASVYPFPYMCNPQMQEMSAVYPVCQTPVVVPAMESVPPRGDYFGGLPPYTSFRIGCGINPTQPCFKGRIDEARISNVQRTFSASIVPTITPTPTNTPAALTGEYAMDPYTAALFHLNFQIQGPCPLVFEEVTQQYRCSAGVIVNNARFNAAMSVSGDGSSIDPGNVGTYRAGSVEAWINLNNPAGGTLFAARQYYNSGNSLLSLGTGSQGSIIFGVDDGAGMQWVDSRVLSSSLLGCWRHVSGTWGPRGLEIWIDGSLLNVNPGYSGGMITQVYDWRIGCDYSGNCVKGILDEVRISSIQRTFARPAYAPRASVGSNLRAPLPNENLTYLPFIGVAPTPSCPFGS